MAKGVYIRRSRGVQKHIKTSKYMQKRAKIDKNIQKYTKIDVNRGIFGYISTAVAVNRYIYWDLGLFLGRKNRVCDARKQNFVHLNLYGYRQ